MRLLAIETSTERLSLAILHGEQVRAREIDAGQRHSELAISELRGLLDDAECTLADLDAIAFGRGPGSFVGVRIACGLAQGLALGAGKPLLGVVTLMALAEQADVDRVLVALDARMGEFYIAAYERSHAEATGWYAVVEPMLARADQFPELNGAGWTGIGSAFDAHALRPTMDERYARQVGHILSGALPSATHIARIAARQYRRSGIAGTDVVISGQALPLYLRNQVALTVEERRLNKAAKESDDQRVALRDVAT